MIYPCTFENKIGFDIIKHQLNNLCLTEGGKKLVENISFSNDYYDVERMVSETEEIRQAILFHSPFPFSEFPNCIHDILHVSVEGSIIEEHTLSELRSELYVFEDCLSYFKKNITIFPLINDLWHHDFNTSKLIADINRIIDEKGIIKDNASEKLMTIRQNIAREQKKADKQIVLILKSAKSSGIVKEDSEISIRDGHAVIPIPATNKKLLRGFVHDVSSTGQTLYIEPDEIFDINNEVRELLSEEKNEINKILKEFTVRLHPEIPLIVNMNNYMSYIDFLRAKANFAIEVSGTKPIILDIPNIHLMRAKHPILFLTLKKQKKEIVPLNIVLNETNRILVISGPNAGGKSIALKTVALLQYMLQCGLLISASENSELGIFNDIFIDIGDEQSIENDLSTYTSHLQNLKVFIEHAHESSLILIDEFGSGTEPQLGGAIAEAALEKLCTLGTKGVITTHYANLKKLAQEKDGLFNGAMLFDKSQMKPLFELFIGKPGSSYTFEIARRVGFPADLLNIASSKSQTSSQINYDKQLEELEIEKKKIDKEKEELKIADDFLKEIIDKYTQQLKQIETSKKDIIRKAQAEAAEISRDSNRKIENAIKEIKEFQAEKEKTRLIRAKLDEDLKKITASDNKKADTKDDIKDDISTNNTIKIPGKIRKKLDEIQNSSLGMNKQLKNKSIENINENKDIQASVKKFEKLKDDFPEKNMISTEPAKRQNSEKIEVGSLVTAYDSESVGEIAEINGNDAKINFNNIIMTVKIKDIKLYLGDIPQPIRYNSDNNVNTIVQELNERAYNFNLNLDVRGMRADEAMFEVTHYIDDAIMLGIHNFSILHGRGNGILRKLIREYLSSVKQVVKFGDETINNGGDGVTTVQMDYGNTFAEEEEQTE